MGTEDLPQPGGGGAVAPSIISLTNGDATTPTGLMSIPLAYVKPTFRDLIAALTAADEAMPEDFDPAQLVGDIRDKVDALKTVIDRMDAVSKWLKKQAAPLTRKAKTLAKNRKKLRKYVADEMARANLEKVPGNQFKLKLAKNPEKLIIDRPATPSDYFRFSGLVKMQIIYSWDAEKIEVLIKDKKAPEDLPARLTRSYRPSFSVNIPESLEPKKRGKKVP